MDITEQHEARTSLETAFGEIKTLKDQLFKENIALREEIVQTSMFEEIVGESRACRLCWHASPRLRRPIPLCW